MAEDLMNTQTGGEGQTIQLQDENQPTPEQFNVNIKPQQQAQPVDSEQPVAEQPIQETAPIETPLQQEVADEGEPVVGPMTEEEAAMEEPAPTGIDLLSIDQGQRDLMSMIPISDLNDTQKAARVSDDFFKEMLDEENRSFMGMQDLQSMLVSPQKELNEAKEESNDIDYMISNLDLPNNASVKEVFDESKRIQNTMANQSNKIEDIKVNEKYDRIPTADKINFEADEISGGSLTPEELRNYGFDDTFVNSKEKLLEKISNTYGLDYNDPLLREGQKPVEDIDMSKSVFAEPETEKAEKEEEVSGIVAELNAAIKEVEELQEKRKQARKEGDLKLVKQLGSNIREVKRRQRSIEEDPKLKKRRKAERQARKGYKGYIWDSKTKQFYKKSEGKPSTEAELDYSFYPDRFRLLDPLSIKTLKKGFPGHDESDYKYLQWTLKRLFTSGNNLKRGVAAHNKRMDDIGLGRQGYITENEFMEERVRRILDKFEYAHGWGGLDEVGRYFNSIMNWKYQDDDKSRKDKFKNSDFKSIVLPDGFLPRITSVKKSEGLLGFRKSVKTVKTYFDGLAENQANRMQSKGAYGTTSWDKDSPQYKVVNMRPNAERLFIPDHILDDLQSAGKINKNIIHQQRKLAMTLDPEGKPYLQSNKGFFGRGLTGKRDRATQEAQRRYELDQKEKKNKLIEKGVIKEYGGGTYTPSYLIYDDEGREITYETNPLLESNIKKKSSRYGNWSAKNIPLNTFASYEDAELWARKNLNNSKKNVPIIGWNQIEDMNEDQFKNMIDDLGLPVKVVKGGDTWDWDNVTLYSNGGRVADPFEVDLDEGYETSKALADGLNNWLKNIQISDYDKFLRDWSALNDPDKFVSSQIALSSALGTKFVANLVLNGNEWYDNSVTIDIDTENGKNEGVEKFASYVEQNNKWLEKEIEKLEKKTGEYNESANPIIDAFQTAQSNYKTQISSLEKQISDLYSKRELSSISQEEFASSYNSIVDKMNASNDKMKEAYELYAGGMNDLAKQYKGMDSDSEQLQVLINNAMFMADDISNAMTYYVQGVNSVNQGPKTFVGKMLGSAITGFIKPTQAAMSIFTDMVVAAGKGDLLFGPGLTEQEQKEAISEFKADFLYGELGKAVLNATGTYSSDDTKARWSTITSSIGSAVESVSALANPLVTQTVGAASAAGYIGSLTSTMLGMVPHTYGLIDEEIESNPVLRDLPEWQKKSIAIPYAIGMGALEGYGMHAIFSGSPSLTNKFLTGVINKAVRKAPKDASLRTIENIIKGDIKHYGARLLASMNRTGMAEAETELIQALALDVGFKEAADGLLGLDEFNKDYVFKDYVELVAHNAMGGYIGGVALGAPMTVYNGITGKDISLINPEAYDMFRLMANDSGMKKMYLTAVANKFSSRQITREEAEEAVKNWEQLSKIETTIHPDISETSDRLRVMGLTFDRNQIEERIKDAPKSQQALFQEDLNRIDSQIESITNKALEKAKEQAKAKEQNDKENEQRIPSEVQEGQESVEAEPVAETSQEEVSPSGVVQEEQEVTPTEEVTTTEEVAPTEEGEIEFGTPERTEEETTAPREEITEGIDLFAEPKTEEVVEEEVTPKEKVEEEEEVEEFEAKPMPKGKLRKFKPRKQKVKKKKQEEEAVEEVTETQKQTDTLNNNIQTSKDNITSIEEEIEIEKNNFKEEKSRIGKEKTEVRKSKLSKRKKQERLEELDAELQDLRDEHQGNLELYRDDIKSEKAQIKENEKQLAKQPKVEAKVEEKVEETPKAEKFIIDGKEVSREEAIEEVQKFRGFFSLDRKKIEYIGNDKSTIDSINRHNRRASEFNEDGTLKRSYIDAMIRKAMGDFSFRKFGNAYRKHIDPYFKQEYNTEAVGGRVSKTFKWSDLASYIIGDSSNIATEEQFRAFAKQLGIKVPEMQKTEAAPKVEAKPTPKKKVKPTKTGPTKVKAVNKRGRDVEYNVVEENTEDNTATVAADVLVSATDVTRGKRMGKQETLPVQESVNGRRFVETSNGTTVYLDEKIEGPKKPEAKQKDARGQKQEVRFSRDPGNPNVPPVRMAKNRRTGEWEFVENDGTTKKASPEMQNMAQMQYNMQNGIEQQVEETKQEFKEANKEEENIDEILNSEEGQEMIDIESFETAEKPPKKVNKKGRKKKFLASRRRGDSSSFTSEILNKLGKAFENIDIHTDETAFIAAAREEGMTGDIESLPAALIKDGEVFLNPNKANVNTAFEEYAHVYLAVMKNKNRNLYDMGLSLVRKEGQEYIREVEEDPNYDYLKGKPDDIAFEALSKMIADRGEKIAQSESKATVVSFLKDVWNFIASIFRGGRPTAKIRAEKDTLESYINKVAKDLYRGSSISSINPESLDKILQSENQEVRIREGEIKVNKAAFDSQTKFASKVREILHVNRGIGKSFSQMSDFVKGKIRTLQNRGKKTINELNKNLEEYYKSKGIKENIDKVMVLRQVDRALKEPEYREEWLSEDQLAKDLLSPSIEKMREMVDSTSKELVDSGTLSDGIEATITGKLDLYLNTSYAYYNDNYQGKWMDQFSENDKERILEAYRPKDSKAAKEVTYTINENGKVTVRYTNGFGENITREYDSMNDFKADLAQTKRYNPVSRKASKINFKVPELSDLKNKKHKIENLGMGLDVSNIGYFSGSDQQMIDMLNAEREREMEKRRTGQDIETTNLESLSAIKALKNKRNLSEIDRLFLGEIQDPVVNFMNTVNKQSDLLFKRNFEQSLIDSGYLASKFKKGDLNTKINKPGSLLNGYYVSPEMHAFLTNKRIGDVNNNYLKAITIPSGITKAMATIFSPTSNAANFASGVMQVYMTGNNPFGGALSDMSTAIRALQKAQKLKDKGAVYEAQAVFLSTIPQIVKGLSFTIKGGRGKFKKGISELTSDQKQFYGVESYDQLSTQDKAQVLLEELMEYGAIGDGINSEIIRDLLGASLEGEITKTESENILKKIGNLTKGAYKTSFDNAADIYQFSDSMYKAIVYMQEKAKRYESYGEIMRKEGKSSEEIETEMRKMASMVVKEQMPSYDRSPMFIKMISRFPLLGPFVQFDYQSKVNGFNVLKDSVKLLQDSMDARKKGYSKEANKMMFHSLVKFSAFSSSMFVSYGVYKLVSAILGGFTDDDDDKFIRSLLAEYREYNPLIHMDSNTSGKHRYIDIGRLDPQSLYLKYWRAFSEADSTSEGVKDMLLEITKPYYSEDIFYGNIFGTFFGYQDKYGKYDPNIRRMNGFQRLGYILDNNIASSTIVGQFRRAYDGFEKGNEEGLWEMANILIGMKRRDLDYEKEVLSKIKFDLMNEILDRDSDLNLDRQNAKKEYEESGDESKYKKQLEKLGEKATESLEDTREFINEWEAFVERNAGKGEEAIKMVEDGLSKKDDTYNISGKMIYRLLNRRGKETIIKYNEEGSIIPLTDDESDPYASGTSKRLRNIEKKQTRGRTPITIQSRLRGGGR